MYQVVGEMAKSHVHKVLISGGEPLLFEGVLSLCREIDRLGILVDMNTNLTLASQSKLVELHDAGVRELTVSLDGATPFTYARCRPNGRLEDVIRNVRLAISLGFVVDFVFVPTKLNIAEFELVANLATDLGAASLTVAGLVIFGEALHNRDILEPTPHDLAALCRRIDAYRRRSGISIRTNRIRSGRPTDECMAGKTICGIDAAGYVHPCALYILKMDEWNDLKRHDFTSIVTDRRFQVPLQQMTGCDNCYQRRACAGGCLGIKRILNVPLSAADPVCDAYTT